MAASNPFAVKPWHLGKGVIRPGIHMPPPGPARPEVLRALRLTPQEIATRRNYTVGGASDRSGIIYFGGKQSERAKNLITPYFDGVSEIISGFFGGGGLEYYWGALGKNVVGSELFPVIANYHQVLKESPSALARTAAKYFPIDSQEKFRHLADVGDSIRNRLENAALATAVYRGSMYGTGYSGGSGTAIPNNFTANSLRYISAHNNPNVEVQFRDYRDLMREHRDIPAYLDPPYMQDTKNDNTQVRITDGHKGIYGKNGDMVKGFDQRELFEIVAAHEAPVVMSHGPHPEILDLANQHNFEVRKVSWSQGSRKKKDSNEILILKP